MKDASPKELEELCKAFLAVDTVKECKALLRDLCTISEINAMSERLQVAKLVAEGVPYRKIAEMTGASTTTVTRVAHWLNHGEGGYKNILE
jgi:TrpR-related protein YerC/YecD